MPERDAPVALVLTREVLPPPQDAEEHGVGGRACRQSVEHPGEPEPGCQHLGRQQGCLRLPDAHDRLDEQQAGFRHRAGRLHREQLDVVRVEVHAEPSPEKIGRVGGQALGGRSPRSRERQRVPAASSPHVRVVVAVAPGGDEGEVLGVRRDPVRHDNERGKEHLTGVRESDRSQGLDGVLEA
ncbi:hypothetical protein [Salana multivorans]|uniref:hypothetical protein n=1 Tax=Salana multivorans TaxID=120377 RepID=UPI002493CAE0|nr:hypothetical protein [Salana multivorans]